MGRQTAFTWLFEKLVWDPEFWRHQRGVRNPFHACISPNESFTTNFPFCSTLPCVVIVLDRQWRNHFSYIGHVFWCYPGVDTKTVASWNLGLESNGGQRTHPIQGGKPPFQLRVWTQLYLDTVLTYSTDFFLRFYLSSIPEYSALCSRRKRNTCRVDNL